MFLGGILTVAFVEYESDGYLITPHGQRLMGIHKKNIQEELVLWKRKRLAA